MGTLLARLESELVRPVVYLGQMTAVARKADNSALFRLLRLTKDQPEPPDDSEFWR